MSAVLFFITAMYHLSHFRSIGRDILVFGASVVLIRVVVAVVTAEEGGGAGGPSPLPGIPTKA